MLNADGCCPICGNFDDLIENSGTYNPDYGNVEFKCSCKRCGVEWISVYELSYDGFQIGDTWVDKEGISFYTELD